MTQIIQVFFKTLHERSIRYCHWKSIDRLDEVFQGETDIDILIDVKDSEKFIMLLLEVGARHVLPRNWMLYPNMEDYLLYDNELGKIYHFHIHYKLVMGIKNAKEYYLPLEELYLETRVFNKEYSTYVVNPEIDIVVLSLRIVQKYGNIQLIRSMFGQINLKNDKEFLSSISENKDLKFSIGKVDARLNDDGRLVDILTKIYNNDFKVSFIELVKLKKYFKYYQMFSNVERFFHRKGRYIFNILAALRSRNNTKHFVKTGVSIALVGADGSGKTTVADELIRRLRYKISAKKYYMGCNKRSYSILARFYVFMSYFMRVFKYEKITNFSSNVHIFGVLLAEYACLVDRKKLFKKSRQDIARGMLVVYERFPLEDTIDCPVCFINRDRFPVKKKYKLVVLFENYVKDEYKKLTIPSDTSFWINTPVSLISSRRAMDASTLSKVKMKYLLVEKYAHENKLIILDGGQKVEDLVSAIMNKIFSL
jgi:hypothetical protein